MVSFFRYCDLFISGTYRGTRKVYSRFLFFPIYLLKQSLTESLTILYILVIFLLKRKYSYLVPNLQNISAGAYL